MVLTKRERSVGLIAGAAIGAWALYALAVDPIIQTRQDLQTRITKAQSEIKDGNALLARDGQMNEEWRQLLLRGMTASSSELETLLQDSFQRWRNINYGFNQTTYNMEDRSTDRDSAASGKKKIFHEVVFHATGTGTQRNAAQFLWSLETAPLPVKLTNVSITPTKEGTDSIQISVTLRGITMPDQTTPMDGGNRPIGPTTAASTSTGPSSTMADATQPDDNGGRFGGGPNGFGGRRNRFNPNDPNADPNGNNGNNGNNGFNRNGPGGNNGNNGFGRGNFGNNNFGNNNGNNGNNNGNNANNFGRRGRGGNGGGFGNGNNGNGAGNGDTGTAVDNGGGTAVDNGGGAADNTGGNG